MIPVEQMTVAGDYTVSNVKIYNREESYKMGIQDYFEDAQLLIECPEGRFLLPSYQITIIRITSHRTKLKKNLCRFSTRVWITANLTYGPCNVLFPNKHTEAGVPLIFRPFEQFSFACRDGLFVTTDFNVRGFEI
jgi:hypothetical protein